MSSETRVTYAFAAALWAIVALAAVSGLMGNPTAVNALVGCSIPATFFLAYAVVSHRDDAR